MKKTILPFFSLLCLTALLLMGCSSESAPLAEIGNVYAEMAQNEQDVAEAYQAVYKASRDEQEALMAKASALAEEVKAKNEKLAEKLASLEKALTGTEIKCEASGPMGFSVSKAFFARVSAQPKSANIVINAIISSPSSEKPYILFFDKDDNVVFKTLGTYSDGKVSVNFRITTNKGPESGKTFASVTRMMIVPEQEYRGGTPGGSAPDGNAEAASQPQETVAPAGDEAQEPEPAYTGETEALSSKGGVTVNGVLIQKGANLAETLRKFSRITWDYNADFGVTATVGNVWITIDEADLTQKGQDVINAIPSDMENNISFSVDYIKPTAKITQFEKN